MRPYSAWIRQFHLRFISNVFNLHYFSFYLSIPNDKCVKFTEKFIECTSIKCNCIKNKETIESTGHLFIAWLCNGHALSMNSGYNGFFCGCSGFHERKIEYSSTNHTRTTLNEWISWVHHVHRNSLRYYFIISGLHSLDVDSIIINMNSPLIDMADMFKYMCVSSFAIWRHCRKITQNLIPIKQEYQ